MKYSLTQFDQGLYLGPPADALPPGALVRARSLHSLSAVSARSRPGSSLLYSLNAHSIFYAFNAWHLGVGTELYKATELVYSGLSGDQLSFARMPPTVGQQDWLFVAGGDTLFKINSSGSSANWGITPPASNPSAADGGAGGSMTEDSTYIYQVTYYNSNTGHRSDGNGTDVSVTLAVGSGNVDLTNIPESSDSQVTHVEIWRSVADGAVLFYLTRITNGTASYNDTAADTDLSSTELPTDNLNPYSWFDDCLGPFNASMFWLSRTQAGERGRVYYSPIGRPESVQGYLEVTDDDDPLQRFMQWSGMAGVVSESRFYQIIGTNPYTVREISGVPGTTKPFTVLVDPYGVHYEAADGIRQFDGTSSALIAKDRITRLFRGEDAGELTSFSGTVAAYARDEYIISDDSQTIAIDLSNMRVRDLGVGCTALHYTPEEDILAATIGGIVLNLEDETATDDNGTAIPFHLEPAHIRLDYERLSFIKRVIVDANPNGQTLSATLLIDNSSVSLGNITGSSRTLTEFADIDRVASVVGIRIQGDVTAAVEVFNVDIITADTQEANGAGLTLVVYIVTATGQAQQVIIPGRLGTGKQSIIFDIDDVSPLLTTRMTFVLKRLFLDIKTGTESVTPTLTLTGDSLSLPAVTKATRATVEIPIDYQGRLTRLTLSGDFTTAIRLFRAELDVYQTGG